MPASPSILERFIRGGGRALAAIVYRVKTFWPERMPAGGFLLVPNHLTWVDAIVLQVSCPRPIRFIVDEAIYNHWLLRPIFRAVGALPISPKRARDSMRQAAEAIRAGEVVCLFPEGELSRSGMLLRLKRGYELLARAADCPVVPVWLGGLWGSIFSFQGSKFFFKWPRHFPYHATVAYGEPIAPAAADVGTVRSRLMELGEFCFQEQPEMQGHLGRACIRGLKEGQFKTAVIDGMDGTELSRGRLLAAAAALALELRVRCAGRRVGIVLPAGKGSMVANLAVVLAGKVPVNLNFTAGRASLQAALRIGEITECITAAAFARRLSDFPWPDRVLHLEELMPDLKPWIIVWRLAVAVLPAWVLAGLLRVPEKGDREEAVILFTSGSSGEPKGVVLSHRNLLGNVLQFSVMLDLGQGDTLLACLPFFHSFGSTVCLWYPITKGIRAVTYPNPLEISKNADLIQRHQITLLCSTPTFLRGYLRKVEPAQLTSLELIVTGAEKLPPELSKAFQERFGKEIMQGYGLTETSPVAAVNLPEPRMSKPEDSVQPSSRSGSVGKLAPGMAARICDPETDAILSLHKTGMVWLRGPNIFERYLSDPVRTAAVVKDGWFKTGDLGRFDEDGFLFIEGRLSRFSKIGGEMVPHETIESRIYEAMELPKEERVIAVTGVPDEAKGEALVLLTTRELDAGELRAKLTEMGLPNLWIPKKLQSVEAIPLLASGKLDLQACKDLALQSK